MGGLTGSNRHSPVPHIRRCYQGLAGEAEEFGFFLVQCTAMIGIILANDADRTDVNGSCTTKLRAEQEEASCTHATLRGVNRSWEPAAATCLHLCTDAVLDELSLLFVKRAVHSPHHHHHHTGHANFMKTFVNRNRLSVALLFGPTPLQGPLITTIISLGCCFVSVKSRMSREMSTVLCKSDGSLLYLVPPSSPAPATL